MQQKIFLSSKNKAKEDQGYGSRYGQLYVKPDFWQACFLPHAEGHFKKVVRVVEINLNQTRSWSARTRGWVTLSWLV